MQRTALLARLAMVAFAVALAVPPATPRVTDAASHREAPLIALDPAADITDFFMFRSYETGKDDKVILIMDVFPGGEPSSGPNYFQFDPSVKYTFYIDNDRDGKADDVRFEFRFKTEVRGTVDAFNLPVSYLGCGVRVLACAAAAALPPITALDGQGSEGLGLRQKYTVTMMRNTSDDDDDDDGDGRVLGKGLIAVPSYVGPSTMKNPADYDALAAQGIHNLGNGIKVFAGQRADPFYIDLGGTFDTLNLRRPVPALTQAEDENDNVNPVNFGVDMIGSFNVQTIALELPISLLTRDGKGPGQTAQPKLGAYASTSRTTVRVQRDDGRDDDDDNDKGSGSWVQVQRLANPLVNEAIIGTEDKDRWNATRPERESAFLDYYNNPRLALALELVYGVPARCPSCTDKTPREGVFNLRDLLLKYQASDTRLSELLRLDVSVAPTPLATQRRMGPLATTAGAPTPDPAAWPNGRRPRDDVLDIAVRVVGGPNYVGARAGDGVNKHRESTKATFPFLGTPQNGRNRTHENPTTMQML